MFLLVSKGRLAGVASVGKRKRPWRSELTAHPLHHLQDLHYPQRLIQNRLACLTIIHHFDYPLRQGEAAPVVVSDQGNAPAEGELDEDAASQSIGYAVAPEREVALRLRLKLQAFKISSFTGWLGAKEEEGRRG